MRYFENPNRSVEIAVVSLLTSLIPRDRPPFRHELSDCDNFLQNIVECPDQRKTLLADALKQRTSTMSLASKIATLRTALQENAKEDFVEGIFKVGLGIKDNADANMQNLSALSLMLGLSKEATKRISNSIAALPKARR